MSQGIELVEVPRSPYTLDMRQAKHSTRAPTGCIRAPIGWYTGFYDGISFSSGIATMMMVHLLSGNLCSLSDLVLGIVVRWRIFIYAIGLQCLLSPSPVQARAEPVHVENHV